MTHELHAIEVEVVEIDGTAPPMKPESRDEPPRQGQHWQQWQHWQGRIRTLDSRWWPLWVVLGAIAMVLVLTVGLVIGIVFVILRIVGRIVRALFR